MTERKEGIEISTSQTPLLPKPNQLAPIQPMQQFTQAQPNMQSPASVPQASPQQVQPQQGNITPVMQQAPQTAPSPHGVPTNSMQAQNAQFYVQTSIAPGMQAPHAIAPAPGPQATTTSVSALHQPLQHQLAPQMNHPGVSPSPMPQQFSPQLQVIQGSIPGGHYVYQNAQGQLIMPGNLTLQTTPGMNNQIQPGAINSLNPPIQVIAAGKPFQGQIAPHMIAGGKSVIQAGAQPAAGGYNPSSNPTSAGNQTVLISQLGGNPTLGVISSQTQNILPAQTSAPKPGELQKVNNMQAFGQIPQGITWASPGTIQSQTLLAGQNPQIFIRGAQPGSEGIFIQNHQPQQMTPQNSMVPPIANMPMNAQQAKPRTGLETQANIQPKVSTMRPAILPSLNPQHRPGASVSTQTAAGQTITQQIGTRPPGKGRSKNMSRAPSAIAMQPGHSIIQSPQMIQPNATGGIAPITSFASSANSMTLMSPSTSVTFNPNKPHTTEIATTMQSQRMNSPMQSTIPIPNQAVYAKLPNTPTNHTPSPQPMPIMNQQMQMSPATSQMVNATALPQNMQQMPTSLAVASSPQVSSAVVMSSQVQTMSPLTAPTQTHPIRPNLGPSKMMAAQPTVSSSKSESKTGTTTPTDSVTTEATNGELGTDKKSDAEKNKSAVNGTNANANKSSVQVKGPPKAMVKPQIMTHVVEGFVIHEASQPFPVSRNSRLSEMSKDRQQTNNTATVAPQVPLVEKNNEDGSNKQDSPKDTVRCEGCGKTDQRAKFKKYKKFCSSACSKRPRHENSQEDSSNKMLKLDNENASILTDKMVPVQDSSTAQGMDEEPKVDILKWTVKDVVDFIQNLPGCQDYAEDFELQEIDGQALMLLKADHLMSAMSIKLGPALKICDKVEAIRSDKKEQ